MAHEVRGQLGSEFAAVLIAPKEFRRGAVLSDTDDAEIGFGIALHVFEIFASARDDENLTDERRGVEARRNGAENFREVEIFRHFLFVEQIADIAAVPFVPAKTVHIGGGLAHFLHKGRFENVLSREFARALFQIVHESHDVFNTPRIFINSNFLYRRSGMPVFNFAQILSFRSDMRIWAHPLPSKFIRRIFPDDNQGAFFPFKSF